MTALRYTPKNINNVDKIFLPDHPCSDKQGFIRIDHPGLLNELTSNIRQKLRHGKSNTKNELKLLVSNKTSEIY
jgi:hypothetical protein